MSETHENEVTGGAAGSARLRALVVEDEPPLVRVLTAYLEREGFAVTSALDGERAVELAPETAPDVVLLDVMLPGIDGIGGLQADPRLQRRLHRDADRPRRGGRQDRRPVDGRQRLRHQAVLAGRVDGARARDAAPAAHRCCAGTTRRLGDLTIDVPAREVTVGDRPVELTPREFALLDALSQQPRVVFSREQLLERVWGRDWFGDEHVVDVHIANLRSKLGDDPRESRYVRTVRGVGYRMGSGE